MKKIAIIITGLSLVFAEERGGGGEILLKNLIFELISMPELSLYIFAPEDKELIPKINQKFPNVNIVTYKSEPYSFSYVDELIEILKSYSFDKIINYNMVIPYKTTILQSHSFFHRVNKVFWLFRKIKIHKLKHRMDVQERVFKRAQIDSDYIAVSNIIKDDYSKYFNIPSDKIKVVYPGVHIKPFKEAAKKDNITFGIVANSSFNKSGHYFLFALGILNLFNLKFNIKIIAPKYDKDILMRLIIFIFVLKRRTQALPYQEDMTYFYDSIDALVLPSINEAFGLVTLEAMERGKPCVVSSTAGSSEIITDETGFVFNRNSFIDFLKKLFKMIKLYNKDFEKFKIMSNKSRKEAEKYTWHDFAQKVIQSNE